MFSRMITKQQRLATTLVVCLLYQMGACPCGCLEHNYWFQALGLAEEDHSETLLMASDDRFLSSHDDDCDGSPALLYVDNSLTPKRNSTSTVWRHLASRASSTEFPQAWRVHTQDRGPPDRHHGQPYCAVIQVFLI